MKQFLILCAVALACLTTGCNSTTAGVVESDLHAGIVDIQDEVDKLAADPSSIDKVEAVIAPIAAKSAALTKANNDFLALWNSFKAGTVGPSGSPVTVTDLQMGLAALEALTGSSTPAKPTLARRKKPVLAAAPRAQADSRSDSFARRQVGLVRL